MAVYVSNIVIEQGFTFTKIKISLTDEQTSQLKPGRYVYDVAIQDGGFSSQNDRVKVVEGTALVRSGVTK